MQKIIRIVKNPFILVLKVLNLLGNLLELLPLFRPIRETRGSEVPVTWKHWIRQRILGKDGSVYWPIHPSSQVSYVKKIIIGKETSPGYNTGCYIHGVNGIFIGDYTEIGPNVGIMSGNHDLYNLREQVAAPPIVIGKYCWLGMNSVILPGVTLGDFTIVGAGAIVTKSFPEGHCVIAGSPARKIKDLEKEKCIPYENENPYIGFMPAAAFEQFRKNQLHL